MPMEMEEEDEDEDEVNFRSDASSRSISFSQIFDVASRGARAAERIVGKSITADGHLGGTPTRLRPCGCATYSSGLRASSQVALLKTKKLLVLGARFKSASSQCPHYSSDQAATILARRVEDDWWRALYNASRSLFAVAVCVTEIRVVISGEIEQQSV